MCIRKFIVKTVVEKFPHVRPLLIPRLGFVQHDKRGLLYE